MSANAERRACVYMLTNRGRGTLYIGVTTDLRTRIWQHKNDVSDGFSKRYRLKRLVYFEEFRSIRSAIAREKTLKGWKRERKVQLIEAGNLAWADLAAGWFEDRVDPSLRSG